MRFQIFIAVLISAILVSTGLFFVRRYSEAAVINFYDQPVLWTTLETHYDLKSGRYIASGIDNMETVVDFSFQTTPDNFSPQALRSKGVR